MRSDYACTRAIQVEQHPVLEFSYQTHVDPSSQLRHSHKALSQCPVNHLVATETRTFSAHHETYNTGGTRDHSFGHYVFKLIAAPLKASHFAFSTLPRFSCPNIHSDQHLVGVSLQVIHYIIIPTVRSSLHLQSGIPCRLCKIRSKSGNVGRRSRKRIKGRPVYPLDFRERSRYFQ